MVLQLRTEGYNPSDIAFELTQRYDLFMYPGDLLNWLDEIIHGIRSVARLAKALNDTATLKSSQALSFQIEKAGNGEGKGRRRKKSK